MFKAILEKTTKIPKEVTLEMFIEALTDFDSLDEALETLPEVYLEFYARNERVADRAIAKARRNTLKHLKESAESPGYTGWSRNEESKIKVIKYKGNLLHLIWDSETSTWIPRVAFRSVVQALRYGKMLVELGETR